MTPEAYTQACLRTWHQKPIAVKLDPSVTDGDLTIVNMAEASAEIELLKKRLFTPNRAKPVDIEQRVRDATNAFQLHPTAPTVLGAEHHALVGMAGEWHEIAGASTREEKISEAGDMLYYLTVWLHEQGITLAEVMKANIEKIRQRYPETA